MVTKPEAGWWDFHIASCYSKVIRQKEMQSNPVNIGLSLVSIYFVWDPDDCETG